MKVVIGVKQPRTEGAVSISIFLLRTTHWVVRDFEEPQLGSQLKVKVNNWPEENFVSTTVVKDSRIRVSSSD